MWPEANITGSVIYITGLGFRCGHLALVHALASREIDEVDLASTNGIAADFAGGDEDGEDAVAALVVTLCECRLELNTNLRLDSKFIVVSLTWRLVSPTNR